MVATRYLLTCIRSECCGDQVAKAVPNLYRFPLATAKEKIFYVVRDAYKALVGRGTLVHFEQSMATQYKGLAVAARG